MDKEKIEAKYLLVTIHDNDFWYSMNILGEVLKKIFDFYEGYPIEEDIPELKKYIQHLWFGISNMEPIGRKRNGGYEFDGGKFEYFDADIKIVDFFDIPMWANGENLYVPLFEGDIIIR